MGPNMLIMGASYRDNGHSARPICDLASAIRSANPIPGPIGRSVRIRHKRFFGQENASLRRQKYKSTLIALSSPQFAVTSAQTDPAGAWQYLNARFAAAAP